jgi:hypothetical protein
MPATIGSFVMLSSLHLHNSLNRDRFKDKIMQQFQNVTAFFARLERRAAL